MAKPAVDHLALSWRTTLLTLTILVLLVPGAVTNAPTPAASPRSGAPPAVAPVLPAVSLPNPRNYSALGDSITPAYDADGSFDLQTLGPQPWYSYAVGNNSRPFSLYQRLLRLYPNTTTEHLMEHLLAVPGDRASDMVWQSVYAVQNHSGFVTILIGGNDVCDGSGTTYTPTSVANFSQSINHTLRILTTGLGKGVVISLGDVVNVTHLWTLFGGNLQAEEVWDNTCPALLTEPGRALMQYMIRAYNHIENENVSWYQAQGYHINIFDIANYSFSVGDVNHLDYFHPSPSGQANLATEWWSALPYSTMSPAFTYPPALPDSVPVGTTLSVAVGVRDPVPPAVAVTYKETGAFFWSTVALPLETGQPYNGTFGVDLPFNATDVVGTLQLYFSASDPDGYAAVLPAGAGGSTGTYDVVVTSTSPARSSPLASVDLLPGLTSLEPGWSTTWAAIPIAVDGLEEAAGVAYDWTLTPQSLGQVIPEGNGSQALLVAGTSSGSGTVTVAASSGVVVESESIPVSVVSPASSSSVPPATPGASPSVSPAPPVNLGFLLVAIPVVFLAAMALLGFWLRQREKGRPATQPRKGTSASATPATSEPRPASEEGPAPSESSAPERGP